MTVIIIKKKKTAKTRAGNGRHDPASQCGKKSTVPFAHLAEFMDSTASVSVTTDLNE